MRLTGCGQILVALGQLGAMHSRGAEARGERLRVEWRQMDLPALIRAFLKVFTQRPEERRVQPKLLPRPLSRFQHFSFQHFSFSQPEHLPHELLVLWLSVGSEAHHLVFLAKAGEADELANRRVEKPE